MYKPDPPFDTVIIPATDNITGEIVWTMGTAQKKKSDGEHFIIKTELPWVSEEKITVHYEDIYKYTPEKFKSLKKDNPL